jgi:hypothetical protein
MSVEALLFIVFLPNIHKQAKGNSFMLAYFFLFSTLSTLHVLL